MSAKIRLLIIDDSVLIRKMLKEVFDSTADIEVIGMAADPFIARDKIKQLNPDVLTLDVEMPRMNGLQFLNNLMRLRPMPVVMVSTLTEAGAPATLDALEMGAVDYIAKPQAQNEQSFLAFAAALTEKVRMAANARVQPLKSTKMLRPLPVVEASVSYRRWIAIGSSTGGTEAIREVLSRLPAHCPPIVITQHIPAVFSASLAMRLDRTLAIEVREACNGLEVRPGRAIIAHGDYHLRFRREGQSYYCVLDDGEKVNRHRPSVEVMFDDLAEKLDSKHLVAVMLTGMGADGARAMQRLHDAGAYTLAQDEASSVVWGMPKAAVDLGAVDKIAPLGRIAELMLEAAV
ncbi:MULTISPECIES: protein-glutamate methylesterase/protein-glutamine glutaminase [Oceanospirillaceae]|jgi:two-component system chemotaxis response regulator CheB|uniref:protein-glutamate methylesterase/protein-glutamine glutaminase n=1 Tax=Oceanospirillaceae TaxID=135620 RepID=UPI000C58A281|nr:MULTISPECIES: chemotaxis response regulator protein-glutamate methylesterase [Thalassolituus]MAY14435.1 chemotaxis response regulator protein-glutamate methylesterase [Oceanospirillaceae bacterium]PIQ38862.1 MAG: chemotaxis response regulator protein-glutamate methylesterase [Thalassolituus sp. CG17_big_fil_post_rev_8_21_14_2_50_53_8]MCB2385294.1 chemotaxis response regulator protein-glutamate methylesterase [Thalassolituus alkanivorans]MCB2421849.1 chemotaxis response regulator protein-glut